MQFTKTIGHEKQKRLFERAVENGRLGHAYVLVGEEGVGKTTFARELASILGADPVLDVFSLGEDGSIPVEEARSLQSLLALSPVGKYKAAIINADSLGAESANALLKTLEEPPSHSLLFLISSNFYSLLPTIASRVQKIVFSRSTDGEIRTALADLHPEDTKLDEILKLAHGRIGRAVRLAASEQFFEFMRGCGADYQALDSASLAERLKTAERIASLETPQIKDFLHNALRRFTLEPQSSERGRKLVAALNDLEYNVNVKLAMDNLFL